MGIKAKPPTESDYWEGVGDGIAEVSEQIGGHLREGIAQAEAEHTEPADPDLDLIKRRPVIVFLQGLARKLDEIAARTQKIIEDKEG